MSSVPVWHLFAYKRDDATGRNDEHREVAEYRVEDAFRWARFRGYDTIMFTRTDKTVEYEQGECLLKHEFPAA